MYVINNVITQLISISVNGGLANLRNAQNIIIVYIRQPLAPASMSRIPSIMVWLSAAASQRHTNFSHYTYLLLTWTSCPIEVSPFQSYEDVTN